MHISSPYNEARTRLFQGGSPSSPWTCTTSGPSLLGPAIHRHIHTFVTAAVKKASSRGHLLTFRSLSRSDLLPSTRNGKLSALSGSTLAFWMKSDLQCSRLSNDCTQRQMPARSVSHAAGFLGVSTVD